MKYHRLVFLKKRFVFFENILEYDSNIVQEEVDNFTSIDTRDWSISSSLDLRMDWSKAKLGWGQESSLFLGNETYTRHKELDLVSKFNKRN